MPRLSRSQISQIYNEGEEAFIRLVESFQDSFELVEAHIVVPEGQQKKNSKNSKIKSPFKKIRTLSKIHKDLNLLSSVWILACRDKNSLMTYRGTLKRLKLQIDSQYGENNYAENDLRELILTHGELFRTGVNKTRLAKWKLDLLEKNKSDVPETRELLPTWLIDETKEEAEKLINELKADNIFRSQFRTKESDAPSDITVLDWGLQHIANIGKLELERRELRSKWGTIVLTVFSTAVITVLGGWFSTWYSAKVNFDNQIKNNRIQAQQAVFAELYGLKFTIKQLTYSMLQSLIESDFFKSKSLSSIKENDKVLYNDTSLQWQQRRRDLFFEFTKQNQSLYQTLGKTRILFPNKLDTLTQVVYMFDSQSITLYPSSPKMDSAELSNWKDESLQKVKDSVEIKFTKPIENLLKELEIQIKSNNP